MSLCFEAYVLIVTSRWKTYLRLHWNGTLYRRHTFFSQLLPANASQTSNIKKRVKFKLNNKYKNNIFQFYTFILQFNLWWNVTYTFTYTVPKYLSTNMKYSYFSISV